MRKFADNSLLQKMARGAQAVLLFFTGISIVQNSNGDAELKLDQALLTVSSFLPEGVGVLYVSDACYRCLPQLLLTVEPASQGMPSNMSVVVSTRFPLVMDVFMGRNVTNVVCRWRQLYGEQGHYLISVKRDPTGQNQTEVSCVPTVQKEPENSYIPLGIAFAVLVALILLYFLGSYISIFSKSCSFQLLEKPEQMDGKCYNVRRNAAIGSRENLSLMNSTSQSSQGQWQRQPNVEDSFPWTHSEEEHSLNIDWHTNVSHNTSSKDCCSKFNQNNDQRLPTYVSAIKSQLTYDEPSKKLSRLSLTLMIFVNYGGGGYWFFEHTAWNGLTVADLVMAWFVFIIGTSVALAFHAMMRRGVSRMQLVRKLTWRTVILFVIGVCFLNYGPVDGPLSWSWARIPGVLQRLAFTYFVLSLMEVCFGIKDLDSYQFGNWWTSVRDVLLYWPEWIIVAALETLWLCLTFLLPVPGCPRGYLGPGGIGDDGKYPNCTGGTAGYIDKWLLGENHIYRYPTCKELYKTTQPFDPEGVLGTINSIVMAFFGLQAGKIILMYRQKPRSILKRFLIWAILLGIISAILSKCTQNEGFIPVNKNLWSLSYVTTLSSFSFVLLGIMFYVIDVKNWWGGQPFIFPGMNSIFVYVGHSLLGSYFPFNWEMKSPTSHTEPLFQNMLGTSIWVFIAYLLYKKKFFLKI